ncbi:hypothetical protein OFN55_41030, partial [Escherichia coli]|nr:hypothetical protein [Escherichia coli]
MLFPLTSIEVPTVDLSGDFSFSHQRHCDAPINLFFRTISSSMALVTRFRLFRTQYRDRIGRLGIGRLCENVLARN